MWILALDVVLLKLFAVIIIVDDHWLINYYSFILVINLLIKFSNSGSSLIFSLIFTQLCKTVV